MILLNFFHDVILFNLSWILLVIYLITVVSTSAMVIHEKRDPAKTSTWVLLLILLPIIGLVFYIFFGQNRRKEKIFNRKGFQDLEQIEYLSRQQVTLFRRNRYNNNSKISNHLSIITLLLNNSKALLTEFNNISIFQNGQQAFDSIIDALYSATSSIHIEFYIINNDKIGNRIKNILVTKAKEGVKVRLIYDDVGSWSLPKKYINELREAGVEAYPFMEVKFPLLTSKVNYRNHRKIVVVDGAVAYLGGMNIADRYIEGSRKLGQWKDTLLQIEGEAVHSLQVIFLIDWYFVTGDILSNRTLYFPEARVSNYHPIQIVTSGPDSDWASIMQAFFHAISRATHHIYISSPYFIPNESILTALKTAALSGIDVRIILPGKSDSTVVYWSSLSFVSELLDAGIKVYLYQNGFDHSKILMIDGTFSSVGSANMDIRSFEDNFEVAAIIYDEPVTKALESSFMDTLIKCQIITIDNWNKRPIKNSYKEALARLISPLF
ncbi:cardiolipin synthase [Tenuifilaceae bacterium CYCD]|nr:cardiolipin synthase [Tenuifilaceae bacterium CYCD]